MVSGRHLQWEGFYTHQVYDGKPLRNRNSPSVAFDNEISYLGAKLDSCRPIFCFISFTRGSVSGRNERFLLHTMKFKYVLYGAIHLTLVL